MPQFKPNTMPTFRNKSYYPTDSFGSAVKIFKQHHTESLESPTEETAQKYFNILKNAALFKDIIWDSVYKRKLKPPFNGHEIRNSLVAKNKVPVVKPIPKIKEIIKNVLHANSHEGLIEPCGYRL